MAEQIDSQTYFDEESESLRKTLEQMRREAEEEVRRLHTRLVERDFAPDSSIATATERLAMQQEMTMLHQTLEAKEQALEHITVECRRLEDELEDQHMAQDGLRKEVDRKEQALKEAHGEIERLRQELIETRRVAERAPAIPVAEPVVVREPPRMSSMWLLVGGGVLFVLLSLVMVGVLYMLWGRGDLPWLGVQPSVESTPLAPVVEPAAEPAPLAVARSPASESEPLPSSGDLSVGVAPSPPRVHRDRLRDGGSGPSMAVLDGGLFQMGHNSLSGEDFSPARRVSVSPFMIGVHEVTFDEYDRFARATGRPLPDDAGWGRGARPVVGVSWEDARAYAAWLSQQTNRRYRLPSEAEWEFAARAGTTGAFWWGFEPAHGRAACFDCGGQWDNRSTAPVMSFEPNPFGLHDTAGNAMEWVADCYQAGYQDAPTDGRAKLDGDCANRVARGGAFNKPSSSMRSHVRARFPFDTRLNMLGFRVARDL